MRQFAGFVLIELILFIIITSIFATTLLLAFNNVSSGLPTIFQTVTANQLAQYCMEILIDERRNLAFSNLSVPGSYSCPTSNPAGFTANYTVATTTINSDSNYETITVTIGGNANAVLTTLIANY